MVFQGEVFCKCRPKVQTLNALTVNSQKSLRTLPQRIVLVVVLSEFLFDCGGTSEGSVLVVGGGVTFNSLSIRGFPARDCQVVGETLQMFLGPAGVQLTVLLQFSRVDEN